MDPTATSRRRSRSGRVVVHLDLDCFYAQVEQRRLGLPAHEPIAVQQWGSLLAVNYVARGFGVQRGEFISDAKKKCPKIHLPHVDTLGENRRLGEAFDRTHQKAILRRYRVASREIFAVLGTFTTAIEKASIDEAFLDVTDLALKRLADMTDVPSDFCQNEANKDTKVFGISTMDGIGKDLKVSTTTAFPLTEDEKLLCVGAIISREIRAAVFAKLGYTCSTGIAGNKLLSKLASPLNKPDGQTIIAERFVSKLMQCYPLRKVRGLGGKLGQQLEEVYQSMGPPLPTPVVPAQENGEANGAPPAETKVKLTANALIERCGIDDIAKHLGRETAVFVHRVCSGDDGEDPVNDKKQEVKAFSSVKQFDNRSGAALVRMEQLEYWARIIAEEIILRCEDERIENRRFPRQIVVRYGRDNEKPRTRMLSIAQDTTVDELFTATMTAIRPNLEAIFPLSYMTMSAKDFMALDSRNVSSISSFFTKAATDDPSSKADAIESQLKLLSPTRSASASTAKPAPAKRRKISSFFTQANPYEGDKADATETIDHQNVEEAVEPATSTCTVEAAAGFVCEKCGKRVSEPRGEHEDFHFALELSRADREERSSTSSSSSTQPIGRKKGGPLDAFLKRAT